MTSQVGEFVRVGVTTVRRLAEKKTKIIEELINTLITHLVS